jgi:CHAD domain-containing protein
LNEAAIFRMYYEERIRSLVEILQKPDSELKKDTIHKLRVELKKLRAAAHLVRFCAAGFNEKKFIRPCMKLFRVAGNVRELQLLTTRLEKQGDLLVLDRYAAQIKKARKRAKRHFMSCIDARLMQKLNTGYERIVPYFNAVTESDVAHYLELKSKEIDRLLARRNLKAKQVHKLRSRLKEFQFTLLMFWPEAARIENMDALQELLGQWHDDVVLAACLQKAGHAGRLPRAETEHIRIIKRTLTAESNRLFETIQLKLFNFQSVQQLVPARPGPGSNGSVPDKPSGL